MACESKERKLAWSVYGRGLCGLNLLLVSKERAPEFAQLGDVRKRRSEAQSYEQLLLLLLLPPVCVFGVDPVKQQLRRLSFSPWLTKRPSGEPRLRTMIILI